MGRWDWFWPRGRKGVTSGSSHLRFWAQTLHCFLPILWWHEGHIVRLQHHTGRSLCPWISVWKTTDPRWNLGECEINLCGIKLQRFGGSCFPIIYMDILIQKETLLNRYYQTDQGNIKVFIRPMSTWKVSIWQWCLKSGRNCGLLVRV